MTASLRRVALIHLLANALLLWLAYYWLGLAESRASTLAWSLFVAVIVVGLLCWTYGAALACREPNPWRTALRNLLPLVLFAIVVTVLYLGLLQLSAAAPRLAAQTASWLTFKTRKPVRPQTILRVFQVALWVVWWVVVPVLLLPVASRLATRGFRWGGPPGPRPTPSSAMPAGGPAADRGVRPTRWLYVPMLLLLGLWVPLKLLTWVPRANGFGMQAMSFILRAGVAYFLFGAALLLLAFLTSGGKPRLTQSKTAASP